MTKQTQTKQAQNFRNRRANGFSLLEVILAVLLFGLVATGLIGSFIYSQQNISANSHRSKALFLAQEGLEAVRNIRDNNYNNLIDGTYGLSIQNNQWAFTSQPDQNDIFTRSIIISQVEPDIKQITTRIAWFDTTTELTAYLSNWRGN